MRTPAQTANSQTFCGYKTFADLVARGTALQWYNVKSGEVVFLSTDVLGTATLYVSQTINGCERARSPVSLTVTVGSTTTWNGNSWNDGVPNSYSKAIIAGNYSEAVDIGARSLEITGTAVVNISSLHNVNVSGAVMVANTANLTFINNANLLQKGTTNSNSGNVIIEQDCSPLMLFDFTLWSSPVANQNILSFSPQTEIARFYTYNTGTNKYNAVTPSSTTFGTANGYLIRMLANHPTTPTIWNGSFTGVPNNENST